MAQKAHTEAPHQVLAKQHFGVPPFSLRHANVALRTTAGEDCSRLLQVKPNSLAAGMCLPMLLEGAANQVLHFCAVRCAGQLDSAHRDYWESDSKEGTQSVAELILKAGLPRVFRGLSTN